MRARSAFSLGEVNGGWLGTTHSRQFLHSTAATTDLLGSSILYAYFSPGVLDTYAAERGAFSTWLHQVTINVCLNARRRRWLPWLSLDRAEDVVSPAATQLIDEVVRGEDQRRIWKAVQRLPLKLRAAIVMRYYHDLSYEEVAQALGCPIGTVRSRLAAAHAKLRKDLEKER